MLAESSEPRFFLLSDFLSLRAGRFSSPRDACETDSVCSLSKSLTTSVGSVYFRGDLHGKALGDYDRVPYTIGESAREYFSPFSFF